MTVKDFEIWTQWISPYSGTEDFWTPPVKVATYAGRDFNEAVSNYVEMLSDSDKKYWRKSEEGFWTDWGVRVFPSFEDANRNEPPIGTACYKSEETKLRDNKAEWMEFKIQQARDDAIEEAAMGLEVSAQLLSALGVEGEAKSYMNAAGAIRLLKSTPEEKAK